jgi:hypothetical protein
VPDSSTTVQTTADSRVAYIEDQITAGRASRRAGLKHYRNAGQALLQVKRDVGHGGFGEWLERHLPKHARTAQMYMKLAKEFPPDAQPVADMEEAWRRITGKAAARPSHKGRPPKPVASSPVPPPDADGSRVVPPLGVLPRELAAEMEGYIVKLKNALALPSNVEAVHYAIRSAAEELEEVPA